MDRYAVVGNPVAHSKSPQIHSLFAEQTGQPLTYTRMLVKAGAFDEEVSSFFALGGKGLNVTVPFKEEAYNYADHLTERAQRAGAVNTLVQQTDGHVLGDNTDGAGMVADILAQEWPIAGQRLLLLGAGGAVRGVLQPLLAEQPAQLLIVNRTEEKAQQLAQQFADCGPVAACSYPALADQQFDLIINGTSASLQGALPPLPDGLLAPDARAYDMMYAPDLTPFLVWAREQGAEAVSDGLGMLVRQAAESFYLWRAVRPDAAPVLAGLREQG